MWGITFLSVFILDRLCLRYIKNARWFALHGIINFINMVCASSTLVHALQYPIDLEIDANISSLSINSRHCKWPMLFTLILHLYHILFFPLRWEDIFHHLLFVPFLISNTSYETKNLTIFFGSGLPGMLTYIALVCKRYKLITPQREKYISFLQNLLFRTPGLLFTAFSVFYSYLYAHYRGEKLPVGIYYMFFISLLAIINALYYLQQITGSFYLKT